VGIISVRHVLVLVPNKIKPVICIDSMQGPLLIHIGMCRKEGSKKKQYVY